MKAIEVLEAAGYETIVFHAVGSGGRAMEALMKEGVITAVLDLATIEVDRRNHAVWRFDDRKALNNQPPGRGSAGRRSRGRRYLRCRSGR